MDACTRAWRIYVSYLLNRRAGRLRAKDLMTFVNAVPTRNRARVLQAARADIAEI